MKSDFTTRPELVGTFGVASSTHWLASQTAMGVLERGGNAFDAVVAAGLVLQVVEPHQNGPAGEVPILSWSASSRRLFVVNGQGPAPALAKPSCFSGRGLDLVPGIGISAATVPGAFGAWMTLLRDHGTWRCSDIMAPAISYARDGFPVVSRMAQALLGVRELFLTRWPTSAAQWLPGGRIPRPGTIFNCPALGATYARIAQGAACAGSREQGIDVAMRMWYEGFVASEIDAFCRRPAWDSSGQEHIGLLRADDMAGWRPTIQAPVVGRFGRFDVAKCGFWSQGPMMLQALSMLSGADIDLVDFHDAQFVHRVAEACKLAFADRLAWYGTAPGSNSEAQAELLSVAYARARWQQVDLSNASQVLRPGEPNGLRGQLPQPVGMNANPGDVIAFGAGEPTIAPLPLLDSPFARELFATDTSHVCVIDRHGNMVSATPSGGWLSSSPVIPSLGFALNTRLQAAWLQEGLPATLTPGFAPLNTLSPTIVMRDGEPYMAFGTPGGDQQDQWQLTFFLRHAVFGLNMQEAIDAPGFHVKHYPSSFWPRHTSLNKLHVESRLPGGTIGALKFLGHDVVIGDAWSEGRLSACSQQRDQAGRLTLRAAASPRGMQGYAVGR